MEYINFFIEVWKTLWSFLGPLIIIILILYIANPSRFEKLAIHLQWFLSTLSDRMEKHALSKEVAYMTSWRFKEVFPWIERVPHIAVEWGEEERVILEVESDRLILVLRRGKKNRDVNVAKALIMAIPYLLAPEMESVYDRKVLTIISAHIARSLVKDSPLRVEAINEVIRDLIEEDPTLKELSASLIDIDDRSLFTRVLIPEMIEVARERYPQRDPRIDRELIDLVKNLAIISRAESVECENPFCRVYFRAVFVLVARPEKIDRMLLPHVEFVKRSLDRCRDIRSIYILAAGRNVVAARALRYLLENELRAGNYAVKLDKEDEYRGRYKESPSMRLYLCRFICR